MDIIDQAQQFEAINFTQSLQVQAAIARNTVRPSPAGHCLNADCDELFSGHDRASRLFCGPKCAERYEAMKNLKR